jgi:hypothetical protein
VLHGRSTLLHRDEVIATVAPPLDHVAAPMRVALDDARTQLGQLPVADRIGRLGRLLATHLVRFADPRAQLRTTEAAELIALLDDVRVRDRLLRRLAMTNDAALTLLLSELARRAPAGEDAQVAACVAVAAYLVDGVVARAAVERALQTDPDHSLALCLGVALDRAVHPDVVRGALRGADPDS